MTEQLLKQLQIYEGKWVALFERGNDSEIVAVGSDAADASEQAAKKGYSETTLIKVLPANVAYVPFV